MKNIFIAFLISFGATTAFAQPIILQPGSSAVVNGDLVTCQAPANMNIPLCSIWQDGSWYRVRAEYGVDSLRSFDEALAVVKKLKAAGLCR